MKSIQSFWWKCVKLAHSESVEFANDWQWLFGVPIGAALLAWWANRYGYSDVSTGKPIVDGILAGAGAFAITYLVIFIPRLIRAPAFLYGEQEALAIAWLGGNSENLRTAIRRLFKFPAAAQDVGEPQTMLEGIVANQEPRKLFEIISRYEERDVLAVPNVGKALQDYFELYHEFRQLVIQFEDELTKKIINGRDWFPAAWQILEKYALCRFLGTPKEQIIALGNFLNYGITWDRAEDEYQRVSENEEVFAQSSKLDSMHERLSGSISVLKSAFDENS